MDMNMPGIGGLEATRKIARSVAGTKVIMLTVHTENPLPAKVMQAGRQAISVKALRRRKW
jgi:two-component system invasion response regulator UvrY